MSSLRERQQGFFKFLVGVMNARGQALPPFLVAHVQQNLQYDPNNSSFSWFEPGSYPGAFKVADKDVDVFRLWTLVTNAGGSQKITAENAWTKAAHLLELPLQLPQPHPVTATANTGDLIQKAYLALLGTLEHAYIQRMRQARMQQQGGAGIGGGGGGGADGLQGQQTQAGPSSLQMAQMVQPSSLPSFGTPSQPQPHMPTHTPSHSQDGIDNPFAAASAGENDEKKRKSDEEEDRDVKKMKMDPTFDAPLMGSPERDPNSQSPQRASTIDAEAKARAIPTRNKIEYVPLKRELDTFGGRDLDAIEHELLVRARARPARNADEWAQVDVEGLSLSIRSRVGAEVGYALTTLLYLSFMRSSVPNRGFPLPTSGELFDDLMDLLEETAFGSGYDGLGIGLGERRPPPVYPGAEADAYATRTWTERELVNYVQEAGTNPFAALDEDTTKERHRGPLPRRADIILAVLGVFRNLSPLDDNIHICAQHPRLTDLLLRVCALDPPCAPSREACPAPPPPRPYSDALSLKDLIEVRKEVVQVLVNYCTVLSLYEETPNTTRMLMELLASYIVDPEDAMPPSRLVSALGERPTSLTVKPPWKTDTALEVLSRITLPDQNRYQVARHVPMLRVQTLFHALVHMLPVVEQDFLVTFKGAWQIWVEKTVFCLYSLAFLASPELKRRFRADRRLGFGGIMLRLIKRYAVAIHPDWREAYAMLARRAVELVKLVDDAEDLFKTPAETGGAILGFGMGGYGDSGVQRVEKGTGMYGGHQEDVTWTLMATPGAIDEVMFGELDSLARVG
ncbi:hypothetical protein AURDEDRAFT_96670 [Auricularia subglabra TFB-10046 SS5]|nr:hypothetical protein AURDEDRAFT_96670 [Auricularia subglabra TFB-10046 SS5]